MTAGSLRRRKAAVAARCLRLLLPRIDGVNRVNVALLRLVYGLMFFVLGRSTWTHILRHQGAWDPTNAVAWCVWTAFATLAGLGVIRPLRMLPIMLLEIFYKTLWLILVAWPLWMQGRLAGSAAEDIAMPFLWVLLPIVAVPWGHVIVTYVYDPRRRTRAGMPSGAVADGIDGSVRAARSTSW